MAYDVTSQYDVMTSHEFWSKRTSKCPKWEVHEQSGIFISDVFVPLILPHAVNSFGNDPCFWRAKEAEHCRVVPVDWWRGTRTACCHGDRFSGRARTRLCHVHRLLDTLKDIHRILDSIGYRYP